MSEFERGNWFAIKRGAINHPIFAKQPERWFVWTWMLETAAWKDIPQDANGKTIIVKRGQLLTSYRQISNATGVSIQIIRTLFKRFRTESVINTATNTGRLLITICNYEKYQAPQKTANTPINTRATHDQHTKEQVNNIPVGTSDKSSSEMPDEFETITAMTWRYGKRLLMQCGSSEKHAGSMIGKWLKTTKDVDLLKAIQAAQKIETQDPIPYIQQFIQKPKSEREEQQRITDLWLS